MNNHSYWKQTNKQSILPDMLHKTKQEVRIGIQNLKGKNNTFKKANDFIA